MIKLRVVLQEAVLVKLCAEHNQATAGDFNSWHGGSTYLGRSYEVFSRRRGGWYMARYSSPHPSAVSIHPFSSLVVTMWS